MNSAINKIIAIHQPNLFPWLGFFNKIQCSDCFVFLDQVVNNSRTAIYAKRVKIISNGAEYWLTIPLKNKKNEVFVPINSMEIDNPKFIASKHLKTIELNYKKAPFFKEVFEYIVNFYEHPSPLIAERNIDFIVAVAKKFNIKKKFVKSSELNCEKKSTELLIEIVKKLNGAIYLSGDGAEGYQEKGLYEKNGLGLSFMNFKHPVYNQLNTKQFIKGLSIIDAMMNIGIKETGNILVSL